MRRYATIFLALISALGLTAAEPCPLSIPDSANTLMAVYIENLQTGEVVADVNGYELMTPASVTKIVTTATALSSVGPDSRFETRVMLCGEQRDSVWVGDLVVIPSGDPTLESAYVRSANGMIDSICNRLIDRGIVEIKGRVRVANDTTLDEPVPSGWMQEDLMWPYGAGHHALNFRDNRFVLSMPDKTTKPCVPGLEVKFTPKRRGMTAKREPGSMTIELSGRMPKGGYRESFSMPDPAAVFQTELTVSIAGLGIRITAEEIKDYPSEAELYLHKSAPLSEIARSLMVRSDNTMAEGVLRFAFPEQSRAQATESEKELWSFRDMDVKDLQIEDGSGLSRNNRLTAYFLADVLAWMHEQRPDLQFENYFPLAGVEGTVRNLLCDSALKGRLALKSGSMRGVQCYAGYALDEERRPTHVVVIMVNGFTCSRGVLKKSIEDMLIEKFS